MQDACSALCLRTVTCSVYIQSCWFSACISSKQLLCGLHLNNNTTLKRRALPCLPSVEYNHPSDAPVPFSVAVPVVPKWMCALRYVAQPAELTHSKAQRDARTLRRCASHPLRSQCVHIMHAVLLHMHALVCMM